MILHAAFEEAIKTLFGDKLWQTFSQALNEEPPASIRLNPLKCGTAFAVGSLGDGVVPWCADGRYLSGRPPFTFDPLLHAGMYYVQEASSMFIDRVLRQYACQGPVRMLDLCAAPGGKSAVARAVLPKGSLLVSNEPVRARAQVLAENMQKFGHQDVIVTNNYPADVRRSGLKFDVVLADVPCSGEGMFRKDPEAVAQWSVQNVEKCWRLQREIVEEAWQCLRDGGLMIYSTCTYNDKEDERNVCYIAEELGAEVLTVDVEEDWHICGSLLPGFRRSVYRFIPGVTRGEGLFMAVLRKAGGETAEGRRAKDIKPKKSRRATDKDAAAGQVRQWLMCPDDYDIIRSGDALRAVPKAWRSVYDVVERTLKVLSAGVQLGEVKGRDLVPHHAAALSAAVSPAAFARVELGYADAVSYLRKEAVALPPDTPRGYVVVTFCGVPLGFEKNIGNRANNLYPAEWRIKSSHVPEEYCEVVTGHY